MAGTDLKVERKDLYAPRRGVFADVVVPPIGLRDNGSDAAVRGVW